MYNPQLETFIRVADAGSFNKAAELYYADGSALPGCGEETSERIIWLTVITYRYILQNKERLLWRSRFSYNRMISRNSD